MRHRFHLESSLSLKGILAIIWCEREFDLKCGCFCFEMVKFHHKSLLWAAETSPEQSEYKYHTPVQIKSDEQPLGISET